MKETIAQQLKVTEFPFEIHNANKALIYREKSNGHWYKKEYDIHGRLTRYETSAGYWEVHQYDTNGRQIYLETSSNGIMHDSRQTRDTFTWGTYGKNGDQPLKRVVLRDMTNEHIIMILATQRQLDRTKNQRIFINELNFRFKNPKYSIIEDEPTDDGYSSQHVSDLLKIIFENH